MHRPDRRNTRWIIAITAFALLVGGVAVAHQASAASGAGVRAMTFNICGAVCNKGRVDRIATYTAGRITESKVHVAFLQEVCYSQYRQIKRLVAPKGYSMMYTSTTSSGYCDNDDSRYGTGFGLAIAVKGSVSGRAVLRLPVTGGAEKRSLLGGVATIGGRKTFVASVHTSPSATQGLARQLAKVSAYLNWKATQHPVIAGGDFNATPDNPGMLGLYSPRTGGTGRFTELDQLHTGEPARSGQPTFDGSRRKIDYLFVSAKHFARPDARSYPTSISDHCVYLGSARTA
ncbi:MAG TPA: endonuclease/exonuclease/phosphatase family protein [Actinoplanes sp.]|nr:endonuclease/exonuclease/phosphatase family protein [Actinoplanes sp.]